MRTRQALPLFAFAAIAVWLTGCSGGGGSTPPPPPAVISVALSGTPPTTLVGNATASFTASVTNDSANAGVKWTVTCTTTAPATCGSFSSATTASGAATTYTAPGTPPSPATVTITATSVTDSTKSASSGPITITAAPPPPILADGNYVYNLSGTDATGSYFLVGAFTVKGGAITAGEQDLSDHSVGYTSILVATGSGLTMAGSNIQMTINTGNSNIGVGGVETFRGTRVSATRVLISEFDNTAAGTGSIDLQTGTAAPTGGYAFAVGGQDGTTAGPDMGIGGVWNISGTTITPAGSVFDVNDGGVVGQALSFSSGSVTAPDSFGRITFSLTPNTTALASFVLTGYIVGPNRIELVESQTDSLNADLAGTAFAQGTHAGGFTPTNVAGTSYVFANPGADSVGNLNIAGTFTLNSGSTVSGLIAVNDLTTFGAVTITAGNYTVDPTGRVTLSGIMPELVTGTPFAFQLYLDGNGHALELGVDASQVSFGPAFLQTAPSAVFSGNYALSGLGIGETTNGKVIWSAVGPAAITSAGAVTGFTDYNVEGATTSNVALSGTATASTGVLALTGINAASATTSNNYGYLSIDNTHFLAIEVDGAQLGLLLLEQVSP